MAKVCPSRNAFAPFMTLPRRLTARWIFLIVLGAGGLTASAQSTRPIGTWFRDKDGWSSAESVRPNPADQTLSAMESATGPILFLHSGAAKTQLKSQAYVADCLLKFDFMVEPSTQAIVYLIGRYGIQLGPNGLGAFVAGTETDGAAVAPEGASAANPVSAEPGKWHTFEAKFRAPRFDDAHNKTQQALLMEIKIDGVVAQSNTVATGWSQGTEMKWEDPAGPITFAVRQGNFALRGFSVYRADFSAVKVPQKSGEPTNVATLIDLVKLGDEAFHSLGCAECHSVQRDDTALKTGPNLFGLFTAEPRERKIVSGGEGHTFTVKADRAYLERSLRTPQVELAIGEHGPLEGKPYPPVMPPFAPTVVSDRQIDALLSYLRTLNDTPTQGPIVHLVPDAPLKNYDPMLDRLQFLVDRTVRLQRGPMKDVSGRSIHVGLPNAINYTFDPRVLAVAKIWQGGFLDMSGELVNRGGQGLKPGYGSHEIELGSSGVLLAPLNAQGEPIDFSFKEAKFRDAAAISASLNSPIDHLDRLAKIDAQFLGYSRDSKSPDAAPVFGYRVGKNIVTVRTEFQSDGRVAVAIEGDFATSQTFSVNTAVLTEAKVSGGKLEGERWVVPAGLHARVQLDAKISLAENAWHAKPSEFNHRQQALQTEPSTPELPAGYRAETYLGPKDNYGRDQLFEALGLAVAPDGTIVVATRTAGVWRLVKGQWQQFAEGLFDSLGVQVEDEHGLRVVVGQKAEVTRISDTNGDGFADTYETMTDAFSYHGNYHSYLHGPVRDANGNYFISLNLDDAGQVDYEYRAGGKFMGTAGGFRGWIIRVPAAGGFEPWANGLRSPASLGFGPDGRFWYAENQGEYVGTSKLFVVKKGAFYGHPAGLVDLPGMGPASPEIAWENVWAKRERPVVLFPQSRLANSPGNPAWDTTGGKFGPFDGQLLIGDQTQSNLIRVAIERVGDFEQGVAIPLIYKLESGVMRPIFLPDQTLLLGQTGRGWQAKGGRVASLQHIFWDGKTVPPAMHHVSAIAGGFEVAFTVPVPAPFGEAELGAHLAISSWVYRDAPDYGSPELDEHVEPVTRMELSKDRRSLRIQLTTTEQPKIHPQQTARVYRLTLDAKPIWQNAGPGFDAFYTLYQFPTGQP